MTHREQAIAIVDDWYTECSEVKAPSTDRRKLIFDITAALAQVERDTQHDYEEVLTDQRRLVKELDVLMNGRNAAKQASLCDLVGSFSRWLQAHDRETWEAAADVAERFGVYPELNIANGGPEWYRHGKDIATKCRQRARGGG